LYFNLFLERLTMENQDERELPDSINDTANLLNDEQATALPSAAASTATHGLTKEVELRMGDNYRAFEKYLQEGSAIDLNFKHNLRVEHGVDDDGLFQLFLQQKLVGTQYTGQFPPTVYLEGDLRVEKLRKAAEQGNAETQFNLGLMYGLGDGVEQNYTEAAKWLQRAAEQGHAEAQYRLGEIYYYGHSVEQNHAEAVKWFRKAAEQGLARAQYDLGFAYYNGEGVEQNHAEAVKWFRKAAEQGNAGAQYDLGLAYYNGDGVEQNYTEAVKWFQKAAEQGNAEAKYSLGIMYNFGFGVGQNYTEAVKWLQKAAEQGLAEARKALEIIAASKTNC
jgi:TPR repeat protein